MKNIGVTDRVIRIAAALVIGILYFTDVLSGTPALILGILAVVLLATGFISVCPLYIPCKISTVNKKSEK